MASNISEVNKLIATVKPPTLETWLDWKWEVKGNIINSNVWYDIMVPDAAGIYPTVPVAAIPAQPTAVEQAHIRAFNEKAAQAARWISRAAGRHNEELTQPHLVANNPVAMWLALDAYFAPRTISEQISSYMALSRTLKSQDEDWATYFQRQDDLSSRFLALFPPTLTIADIKDLILMVTTIQQLPSENPTRLMLETNPALSNDIVRAAIRQYIASHNNQELPTEAASRAFTAAPRNTSCFMCGNAGHFITTCKFFPYYQELFEKERKDRSGYFGLTPAQQLAYQTKAYSNTSNHPSNASTSRGRGRTRGSYRGRGARANVASEDVPVDAPPMREETAGNASLSSPLPPNAANLWIADTGASISMTFRREWLHGMKQDTRRIRLADGTVIFSAGIGSVILHPHPSSGCGSAFSIHNVLFVPDLRTNLLSVFYLTRNQGFSVDIDDKFINFWRAKKKTFRGTINSFSTAHLDVSTEHFETAAAASASLAVSIDVWHNRFAHRSYHMLEKLRKSNSVEGYDVTPESPAGGKCVSCIEGKLTRAPHTQTATRATRPLERVFTDVHGPILRSREGFEYWLVFVDQYSGFAAIYTLRKKSDAFTAFKQYKAWAENKLQAKIGILRDDKGGEYSSTEFDQFLRDNGTERERTIKDTPQQNGIAERLNRTIDEGITSMLSQSRLPRSLWADAARTLIYIHNRSPSNTRGFKTPYELWSGNPPSVSHLRAWGCLAYVHIQKSDRPVLSPHAKPYIFIGYSTEQKGYIFYDSTTSRVTVSDSAAFFEDKFPGLTRARAEPRSLPTPPDLLDSTPNVSTFHLTPPVRVPPPPPPRTSPPPQSSFTRPPPITTVPPFDSPSPEPIVPSASTDGETIFVRLPGRLGPDDPRHRREESEKEAASGRQVKSLTNREHFEHGYPEGDLPRLRNRVAHGNAAFWIEDDDEEVEEPIPALSVPAVTTPPATAGPASPTSQAYSATNPATNSQHRWTDHIIPPSNGNSPARKASANPSASPQPSKVATSATIALDNILDFAFFASSTLEPNSLAEARARPDGDKWIEAALLEIKAHLANGTWELSRLPHGKHAIGSRWVFKIKRNSDGSVDRYKGRLVAKGYAQREGVDYTDTFAPTARFAALRTVIALAAIEDWELESVDISTAFLNGDIDAEVYMKIPEGVEIQGASGNDWVLKLLKGLYGIKQGPRIWSKKLALELSKLGFNRLECDHSVFIYERDDIKVIVPVHVDDLVIGSKSKAAISAFKVELSKVFKIRDLGPTSLILNVKLERDRANRTITLNQTHYIDTILADHIPHAHFNGCDVPLAGQLSSKDCASTPEEVAYMSKIPYREVVGKLLYLSIATRPDISLAVGILCRFNQNPGPKHWAAVKQTLRYLKSTRALKLHYGPSDSTEPFTTHCDADLGGNPDNSRSTAGYCINVGSATVMWGSRLQPHVSLSSTESEYTTASAAGCELMWMRFFFEEIGYDLSKPSTLWMDSGSAIQVAKNPEHVSTMKHVHRSYNWIRERVEAGDISIGHVPGKDNVADIFTKPLGRVKFLQFRDMLGLRP